MNTRKTIGIDARLYGPIGKGLGRYTKEMTDGVVNDDKYNYVVFLRKENFSQFDDSRSNVKKVLLDLPWYSWSEQILFPYYIWKEKIDLMHFPHFNVPIFCPTQLVVTIHDLILIHHKTTRASTLSPFFYYFKTLAYRLTIWLVVKRAKIIFTVSNFTKQDVCSFFNISPEKVIVTYNGVAQTLHFQADENTDKNVVLRYNINMPFLLYVGNVYPHKNLEKLLSVFASNQVLRDNFQLVLVGKDDYFYSRLKEFAVKFGLWSQSNKKGSVIFTDYVTDEDLTSLYRKSLAYIFPSLYEGFGIPPLEAMTHGIPVISSDRASIPEALGEAALYFNPEDENDILDKILKISKNDDLRNSLINLGYKQAKKFKWVDCIDKTKDEYDKILK